VALLKHSQAVFFAEGFRVLFRGNFLALDGSAMSIGALIIDILRRLTRL
jgi:hypothetical protein